MPLCTCVLSHFSPVCLFASPWTAARQVLVHEILQARILERVAMPPPGDLLDPGIEHTFLMSLALAGESLPLAPPGKYLYVFMGLYFRHNLLA